MGSYFKKNNPQPPIIFIRKRTWFSLYQVVYFNDMYTYIYCLIVFHTLNTTISFRNGFKIMQWSVILSTLLSSKFSVRYRDVVFDNYKYWHYSWKFLVFILLSVVPKLLMANTTFTLSQFTARLKLWSYIRKVIVLIVSNLTRTWGLVRKSCWSQRFYFKKKFLVKKFPKIKTINFQSLSCVIFVSDCIAS